MSAFVVPMPAQDECSVSMSENVISKNLLREISRLAIAIDFALIA